MSILLLSAYFSETKTYETGNKGKSTGNILLKLKSMYKKKLKKLLQTFNKTQIQNNPMNTISLRTLSVRNIEKF